jgi:hypothetical protein
VGRRCSVDDATPGFVERLDQPVDGQSTSGRRAQSGNVHERSLPNLPAALPLGPVASA